MYSFIGLVVSGQKLVWLVARLASLAGDSVTSIDIAKKVIIKDALEFGTTCTWAFSDFFKVFLRGSYILHYSAVIYKLTFIPLIFRLNGSTLEYPPIHLLTTYLSIFRLTYRFVLMRF